MAKKKITPATRYKELLEKVQGMDLGGGGFWKPKEGRSLIRILPPVGDMEFFFQEVGRHYDQKQYCPAITTEGAEECPICEINEALYQAGEKEAAAKFRATRAFWMNIIDRSNEDAGPQIYTPGVQVFQSIVAFISDPEYGDITDEEDGFDLKIDRKGQGIETKYTVLPSRMPSALGSDDEQMNEWIEDARDLSAHVEEQLKDYDDLIDAAGLEAYFDGTTQAEEEEEDEEPVTTRRRRRSRRKR